CWRVMPREVHQVIIVAPWQRLTFYCEMAGVVVSVNRIAFTRHLSCSPEADENFFNRSFPGIDQTGTKGDPQDGSQCIYPAEESRVSKDSLLIEPLGGRQEVLVTDD